MCAPFKQTQFLRRSGLVSSNRYANETVYSVPRSMPSSLLLIKVDAAKVDFFTGKKLRINDYYCYRELNK